MMNKLSVAASHRPKILKDLKGITESLYLLASHPDIPTDDLLQTRVRLLTSNMKIGNEQLKVYYIVVRRMLGTKDRRKIMEQCIDS